MSDVSTKDPSLQALEGKWSLVDDLMGGTEGMRAAGKRRMPQWPLEDTEAYAARLATATLFPAYSETVASMAGRVFAKPLGIGEDVPARITGEVIPNIDLEGRNLHVYAQEWFEAAMNHGVAFTVVDYPRVDAARTKADEKALGVRPYWVKVRAEQVLGWRTERTSSGVRLTQFRYLEIVTEDDGEFGSKSLDQVRVIEPGRVRLYRKGEKGWALHEEFLVTLQEVPVVPLYTNRTGYLLGKPPLLELAHLNVKHWQSQSDQDTILHTARVPLLMRKGVQQAYDDEGKPKPMQINGSIIDIPSPDGDMKYVEHTGAAIDAGHVSLEALQEQMQVAGAKLLTKTVLSLSDTQTKDEQAKEISQLAAMAQALEDSLDLALAFTAMWMGLGDAGGHASVDADLEQDYAPGQTIETLGGLMDRQVLSPQDVFEEAQRRGLISEDRDWKEVQERIRTQMPSGGDELLGLMQQFRQGNKPVPAA